MRRLKTISDKLDYISMGKLNAEQMEYICEIDQEVNLKDKEIERLNSIIKEVREYIKEKYDYLLGDDTFLGHDERIERKRLLEIIGILDKEGK